MIITDIKQKKNTKNRYNIYVDSVFFATILDETIYKNHLKIGQEIDNEKLLQVVGSGQLPLALDTALTTLSSYNKTTKELKESLKKKGFVDNIIDKVIEKLTNNNYLNDKRYAEYYISSHRTKSKKALKFELKHKGIKDEIICEIVDKIPNQSDIIEELAKKFVKNKKDDPKLKEKLFRHLASKGFEFEDIKKIINKVGKEDESWN